jgi:prolipoprotein diacylglyceryltransferase
VGGLITAAIVAGLLGTPVGRWMHALILPLLLGLAAGKAALVLGGSGQGLPFDGAWALAFTGPGPWGSLAPEIPSHPSQFYEALATAAVLLVMTVVLAMGAFRRRTGTAFLFGLALWAGARALVAVTWRDEAVAGPLRMDQLISIAIVAGSLLLIVLATAADLRRRSAGDARQAGRRRTRPAAAEMEWPDPTSRPRF